MDRFFGNLTEAEAFAEKRREEADRMGTTFGHTTDEERACLSFWREFSRNPPTPPDLMTVMRDFRAGWLASRASVTLTEALRKFIENHEAAGSSGVYVSALKNRIGGFVRDHGDRVVSAVTATLFADWLNGVRTADGKVVSPITRHNISRTCRTFFGFCIERGWTTANPIAKQARQKTKAAKLAAGKPPGILLPTDVARFMAALKDQAPVLVPFWAIKFFAGIRDAEAARMDWSMVDLDAAKINIPASVSKTAEDRIVKIEPCLLAWLMPHAGSGPIAPSRKIRGTGFKRATVTLATKGNPFIFPSNAARHSFGTYHLFHFRNAGETSLQLGHGGNPRKLHQHYKNPTAERHASEYWQIFPTIAPNVIGMTSGASTAAAPAEAATVNPRRAKA